jgi:hypothetical protein
VKVLFNENQKSLLKVIEEDTRRWKYLACLLIGRINIVFSFIFLLLFICAYKDWFISLHCPHPLPYHPLRPLPPPQYPAETILPLFLILL